MRLDSVPIRVDSPQRPHAMAVATTLLTTSALTASALVASVLFSACGASPAAPPAAAPDRDDLLIKNARIVDGTGGPWYMGDIAVRGDTIVRIARGLPEQGAARVIVEQGGCQGIFHAMDERDLVRILRYPATTIASDGDFPVFGRNMPHPRSHGTFTRHQYSTGIETRDPTD